MSKRSKIFLGIFMCLFYVPGYFLLRDEIGNEDYDLPGVIIGSFFTLFGLFAHSVLLFEKRWMNFENNKKATRNTKYFFKILTTVVILPFGITCVYNGLFPKSDNYSYKDITLIEGTLKERPTFERGAKSSTYSISILTNTITHSNQLMKDMSTTQALKKILK